MLTVLTISICIVLVNAQSLPSSSPTLGGVVLLEPSSTPPTVAPITTTPTLRPSTTSPTLILLTTTPTLRPTTTSPTLRPTTSSPTSGATLTPSTFIPTLVPTSAVPSLYRGYPTPRYTATPYTSYPTYYNQRPSYYYPQYPSYYYPQYPSYYYPQYPSYYYRNPTSTTSLDTEADETSGRTSTYIVVGIIIVTLLALYCSRSRFDTEFTDQDVDEFYTKLLNSRYMVVHYPPACLRKENERSKPYALFFTTRIKISWVPMLAYLQFVLGWIALVTTIIGFVNPRNKSNNNIGATVLFLSEIVVHLWYGFMRYPNLSWVCLGINRDDGHFHMLREARECCTRLFHGDRVEKEHDIPTWIKVVGIIATIPLHVASVIGAALGFASVIVLSIFCKCTNFEDSAALIGVLSSLIGSIAYPFCFRQGDTLIKVLASIGHYISLEYYEAMHFGKDTKHFLKGLMLKAFGDIVGELDDPDDGDLGEDIGEVVDEANDQFDKKSVDEDVGRKNDGSPDPTFSTEDEYDVEENTTPEMDKDKHSSNLNEEEIALDNDTTMRTVTDESESDSFDNDKSDDTMDKSSTSIAASRPDPPDNGIEATTNNDIGNNEAKDKENDEVENIEVTYDDNDGRNEDATKEEVDTADVSEENESEIEIIVPAVGTGSASSDKDNVKKGDDSKV